MCGMTSIIPYDLVVTIASVLRVNKGIADTHSIECRLTS